MRAAIVSAEFLFHNILKQLGILKLFLLKGCDAPPQFPLYMGNLFRMSCKESNVTMTNCL